MSVESAKACLEKLRADADFAAKLEKAGDDAGRVKIIEDAGFDFTKEDFKEAAAEMAPEELSDKDLEAVAGGSSGTWVSMGTSTGVAAGTAAAAF